METAPEQARLDAPAAFVGSSYDNLVPWRVVQDQACFQIVPAPFPRRAVIILNALFVLFTVGWVVAGVYLAPPQDHALIIIAGILIGLLTCGGFTFFVHHRFGRERAKGPWLTFDRSSNVITLPREKRHFTTSEVRLRFLYIQGASCDEGAELQLVTDRLATEGVAPKPILLLTSIFSKGGPLETLAQTIQTATPIPVQMIPMKDRNTAHPSRV